MRKSISDDSGYVSPMWTIITVALVTLFSAPLLIVIDVWPNVGPLRSAGLYLLVLVGILAVLAVAATVQAGIDRLKYARASRRYYEERQ